MPNKLTKNGVDSSFSGSDIFFKKGIKKNQHATKKPFFLIIFTHKKKSSFGKTFF